MNTSLILDPHGKPFRCMLAYSDTPSTPEEIAKLVFPMFMSPKLDGIRMTNVSGQVVSRSSKVFPSSYVNKSYSHNCMQGFDGEAIKGLPNRHDVFSDTYSAMMTQGCMDIVDWYLFDFCHPQYYYTPYSYRLKALRTAVDNLTNEEGYIWPADGSPPCRLIILPQKLVHSWDEVLKEEKYLLDQGYEGAIIRSPDRPYKFNRSTLNENGLIKIKRFETAEAEIIGFYELEHNDNEAFLDERGFTKRSTHKENKRASGLLGGFHVRDLKSGVEFNVGSGIGMTMDFRKKVWESQATFMGLIISYKKLVVGEKDKPRNCTFRGFRSPIDL